MSFEATRKRVLLLRASAAVLIDGTIGEPGWALAQGLLELAEALVRESGQPAESFGKGGRTCCAACGECDGQHESWCIHAEDQATWGEPEFETPEQAASTEQPLHYFGCCPKCHRAGLLTFIGSECWLICHEHMIAWCAGSGLFSGWQELTPEQHEANKVLIERCERIEPPLCTCSSERSPFEGAAPEWLTRGAADEPEPAEDTAASELLAWLDLSGLPPVPPEEPPARRQNWHFDGPEGGEHIPFE